MYEQRWFVPGTVVSVQLFGVIEHVGIASDQLIGGEQAVLSCSRRSGHMAAEPLSTFSCGSEVRVCGRFQTDLSDYEVLRRARGLTGRKWDLLNFNCEHAVCHALGLPIRSAQLAAFGLLGAATTLFFVALAANRTA